jgi:amino acid transporter
MSSIELDMMTRVRGQSVLRDEPGQDTMAFARPKPGPYALAAMDAPGAEPAADGFADKGLKRGAVGMMASIGVGVASTAPAYSLAATLGFVVAVIGLRTPLLVVIAFVPTLMTAWAIKQINKADPDCGTSFTWAARNLGPRIGWFAGGWGTIASDFLAMASYAQVAAQYVFLLIGAHSIGVNATSPWVLLLGIVWIVVLTWLCWRGIEISARIQVGLVVIEVIVLFILAIVALVKLGDGTAPVGHINPSWSWFDPTKMSFNQFMLGLLLMVFIYWGWDTTTSINEETKDARRIPGVAGVISTFLLLGTYLVVTISVQGFAGLGHHGIGLNNVANQNDVLSPLGAAVFGTSLLGKILTKLLLFMVLTSAAATTQTTILPNARTTLSMAFHRALPPIFGNIHPRYKTPSFSTISFGVLSIVYYAALNFLSHGNVISDAVTATTFYAALYLAISALACAWHYRAAVRVSARASFSDVIVPGAAALILFFVVAWSVKLYLQPDQSYIILNIFGWHVGGTLFVVMITAIIGLAWMFSLERGHREYFSGETMREGLVLTDDDEIVHVTPVEAVLEADGSS